MGCFESWNGGRYFQGASNLEGIYGDVDLVGMTSFYKMFDGARKFNSDVSGWNTENITNMHRMFQNARKFNQSLNNWDVSKVTDLRHIFHDAHDFNGDISSWDFGRASDLSGMFWYAKSFNSDISGWDLTRATNMRDMFRNAESFNQDISGWNMSTITRMYETFKGAGSFNQDISSWDVSNVNNMYGLFSYAGKFNQDLSGWRVCKINSKPTYFDIYASSWQNSYKPKFGHPCTQSADFGDSFSAYTAGDVLQFDVSFNKNVVVTGTPQLELKFDSGNKKASYVSGSGGKKLSFNYTVLSTDNADALDYNGIGALSLNGGTINAASGNKAAILTLPYSSLSSRNILVNGSYSIAPEIVDFRVDNSIGENPTVGDKTPAVSFRVVDRHGIANVSLSVDGGADVVLETGGTSKDKVYSHDVASALSTGNHKINVSVADSQGASRNYTFPFVVDTVLDDFASYWDTSKTSGGGSNNKQIRLPLQSGGDYDFTVHWGDGSSSVVTSHDDADRLHTYSEDGVYRVNIVGTNQRLQVC